MINMVKLPTNNKRMILRVATGALRHQPQPHQLLH